MSFTPTHGDPLRREPFGLAAPDPERWLPDPSWPVPPRGWQLWAAAGSATRPGRSSAAEPTDAPVALESASFTLPTRPALDRDDTVDLLADLGHRGLPEGAGAGFAIIGGLVIFGSLVGGLTGGLVVIGVSTLLAAVAALVHDRLTLTQVGGQRGAGLLLGTAVTALIIGTVAAHDRASVLPSVPGAPLPLSSPHVSEPQTSYAAVPSSGISASVAPSPLASATASTPRTAIRPTASITATPAASARPSVAASAPAGAIAAAEQSTGSDHHLTLSPNALSPKPGGSVAAPSKEKPGATDPKTAKEPKLAKGTKDKGGKGSKDKGSTDKGATDKGTTQDNTAKGKADKGASVPRLSVS
jgi:hypothetical protein